MSFRDNIIHTFGARIFIIIFGLVTSIVNARILGPSQLGDGVLLLFFPPIFAQLACLGTDASLFYYLAKEQDKTKEYMGTTALITIVVSIVATALFYWVSPLLIDYFYSSAVPLDLFYLVVLSTPLEVIVIYARSSLRALNMIKAHNLIIEVLPTILKFGFIIGLVAIADMELKGYIYACISVTSCTVLMALFALSKARLLQFSYNHRLAKNLVNYGLRHYTSIVTRIAKSRLETSMIALFLSNREVGIYSIASNMAVRLRLLEQVIAVPLLPQLARLSPEDAKNFANKIMNLLLVPGIIVALGTVGIGYFVLEIAYGEAYLDAYLPMVILVSASVPSSLFRILSDFFSAINLPEVRAGFNTLHLALRAVFLPALMSILVLPGCAAGIFIGDLLTFYGCMAYYKRSQNLKDQRIFITNPRVLKRQFSEILSPILLRLGFKTKTPQ